MLDKIVFEPTHINGQYYKTRCGGRVKIYSIDNENGEYYIHGAKFDVNEWKINSWKKNGTIVSSLLKTSEDIIGYWEEPKINHSDDAINYLINKPKAFILNKIDNELNKWLKDKNFISNNIEKSQLGKYAIFWCQTKEGYSMYGTNNNCLTWYHIKNDINIIGSSTISNNGKCLLIEYNESTPHLVHHKEIDLTLLKDCKTLDLNEMIEELDEGKTPKLNFKLEGITYDKLAQNVNNSLCQHEWEDISLLTSVKTNCKKCGIRREDV